MYGASACKPPRYVSKKKLPMNNQKFFLDSGLNLLDLTLDVRVKGATPNISIAKTSAIIPPNFEGTDFNIA